MNVQFEYLYRDAGNFKKWNTVVFTNPANASVDTLTQQAREVLIDQSYFVAEKAGVPDLHFSSYDEDLDHGWHEFHGFTPTCKPSSDPQHRSINEFMNALFFASIV